MANGRLAVKVGTAGAGVAIAIAGASTGALTGATLIVATGGAAAAVLVGYGLYRWISGGTKPPDQADPNISGSVTPKSIIEEQMARRLQANPAMAKEINAVLHFQIDGPTGGTWTVDCTKETNWITPGAIGTPQMTVACSDGDFVRIVKKEINAQIAAMQGKLRFTPIDTALAMHLGKLLT